MNTTTDSFSIAKLRNRFDRFLSVIADSPDLLARLLMIITVYVLIMIPSMVVLLQWIREVFYTGENLSIPNYLFEVIVIGVVFLFGTGLLYAVVYDRQELHFAISIISLTLVILGAWILGEISNRCILDLQCSAWKYLAGLAIVTGVTFLGLVLSKMLRIATPFHGLAFLVIAITQSELWLYVAYRNQGIPPTSDAIRAFMLLFYSFFWLWVFQPKKEEPIKNRYSYR